MPTGGVRVADECLVGNNKGELIDSTELVSTCLLPYAPTYVGIDRAVIE